MRISYWSSDVCSSDLVSFRLHPRPSLSGLWSLANVSHARSRNLYAQQTGDPAGNLFERWAHNTMLSKCGCFDTSTEVVVPDRKSVVKGTSGLERVDIGGRRILKKKKSTTDKKS